MAEQGYWGHRGTGESDPPKEGGVYGYSSYPSHRTEGPPGRAQQTREPKRERVHPTLGN